MQDNTSDRNFLEAVGICYNYTPAITDTQTNLEFTMCHATHPQFHWGRGPGCSEVKY